MFPMAQGHHATRAKMSTLAVQPAYIDRLQILKDMLADAQRDADEFAIELESVQRLASMREQRLTIELYQSEVRAAAAEERADAERAARAEALRTSDDYRGRAEWAAEERTRLARLYEDACIMARNIERSVDALESELREALVAKDAQIRELGERNADLQATFLTHVQEAIAQARAENERLSRLVSGVQRGRVWRFKRALQRVRGLFGH